MLLGYGAVEQLGRYHKLDDRPRREQEISGAEQWPAPAGAGFEPDRTTADQVLREEELAIHAGTHRSHPMGDPRCHGIDLHGERMPVGDADVDPAFARLGLIAAAGVGTGGGCQQ
jgi:hypothetical protein